jgi:nucleoside phosphorylase/CheY-like chemotaxis protein
MISVLLVEDGQEKIQSIAEVISAYECDLEIRGDVYSAKRALQAKRYDLLLLDINLPRRPDRAPDPDGGLEILRWLRTRGRSSMPTYIVGLTSYEESYLLAVAEFGNLIWAVISVSLAKADWKEKLAKTLGDITAAATPPFAGDGSTSYTDLLIVTALDEPEMQAVLNLPGNFERLHVRNDSSIYYSGRFKKGERSLSVVAVAASDKGFCGTAIATTKGIYAFWPKYVYMPGITAGVEGRVNVGDVIFADLSWDWGSGKFKEENGVEVFYPASYQRRLDETLARSASEMKLKFDFLHDIWTRSSAVKPSNVPRIMIGAMASGASVLQSSKAVQRVIAQQKDLLAIEMEAFSLLFACQTSPHPRPFGIVAKAVCDNGDRNKNDVYQSYAAYVSAQVLYDYAMSYLAGV